jgi:hypothetical protein
MARSQGGPSEGTSWDRAVDARKMVEMEAMLRVEKERNDAYTWQTVSRVYKFTCGTMATCFTVHAADCLPCVIYAWQTVSRVFHVPRGTVATCIYYTRGELYI